MKDLKVTTNEVKATIRFDKDTKIEGTIFLGTGQYNKPLTSKVSSYLEDAKEFVPFQVGSSGPAELINKNNIMTVEWEDDADAEEDELMEASHKQDVTITFIDNDTITGTLVSDTPSERSRLSDCLNTRESFIHITSGKRHIHVNKKMLLRVIGP